MDIVPYTFREAKFLHGNLRGYWVTIFCVFDGKSVYSFFHESDRIDNCMLMKELGVDFDMFHREIIVSPNRFPDIFSTIEDYVQKSSFSG